MTDNEPSKKQKFRQETKDERRVQFKERRRKKAESKLVGFRQSTHYIDSALTNESIYYIDPESPKLRKIYPYFFTWITHAKERWYGRTIEDIFQYEFRRSILKQNFDDIIRNGLVRINGQCIEKDYIMKNGDKLEHFTHRHEVPVINQKFNILINNDDYLVIDKPCSIPVHPCGKYRFNTVLAILNYEYQLSNLRTVHRLDRMTSGILIMAKSAAKARVIDFNADRSSTNSVDKLYLCRVRGEFPYVDQIVRVDQPLETFSFQIGLTKIGGNKQCQTLFRRVTFEELKQQQEIHGKYIFDLNNENIEVTIDESLHQFLDQDQTKTSLVLCRPLSGRMHQIRVHLQYLGFPIVNDPLYNASDIWGPSNGQYGHYEHSNEYVIETFIKRHSCEYWLLNDIDNEDEAINSNGKRIVEEEDDVKRIKTEETTTTTTTIDVNDDNAVKAYIKEHCYECLNRFREPSPDDLVMFLHALQYKISDATTFTSPLPEWAQI
ncbi:unnamed protein product [Rotaria socialis]|uniref:Pseudouridine synthase RsuA/RluA-like domain-containing protein n=1 Tax=Rotaria socialis TaxID=392032 RepID=A0A820XDD7_9BILA|nr:unnamed protein product [Rotaria socialis]CAF3417261.1 unnamed protein product [Rotaria socialis]CAF3594432.1 unnamed protein product [Rotaria socialis]CAF3601541.1 unnamed protein product [Rotaria socialis]CAF4283120.1 unnamed protein product [Rotaria socialis]